MSMDSKQDNSSLSKIFGYTNQNRSFVPVNFFPLHTRKDILWYPSFIYLEFYVAFNTVQVISRWVVGRAEETSSYSSLGFCTVNCRPTASNYQLSHLRPCRGWNPGLRGGRRECYHSATVASGALVIITY